MRTTAWRRLNRGRDHRWAEAHLSDYLDGELPPRERRRLAAHEEQCPDCARLIATLEALLALLSSLRTPPGTAVAATEQALERIRARIEEWS